MLVIILKSCKFLLELLIYNSIEIVKNLLFDEWNMMLSYLFRWYSLCCHDDTTFLMNGMP